MTTSNILDHAPNHETNEAKLALLDLFSGCGGMSTGLCLGAKLSGVSLVTVLAIDFLSLFSMHLIPIYCHRECSITFILLSFL